jgi:hypothetical protein
MERRENKIKNGGSHVWRGKWRASKNGGWEWEFVGVWKMEVHIEALLELFFPKTFKFWSRGPYRGPHWSCLT